MSDLSKFNPNSLGNPNNNIFGLPFTEEEASLILLPVPWEVTVSYGAGTARSAEHIFNAALQVDLFDVDAPNVWKKGFYMLPVDKKLLMKSDYLRKEAELYIDFIAKEENFEGNKFMCKNLKEINEGCNYMNNFVYQQTKQLLGNNKFVGLIGGDHSTTFGYIKSLSEKYNQFGILQIDAHCDLRVAYENFTYSHASIMYNILSEFEQVNKLVQLGIRDYSDDEYNYIKNSNGRVTTFFDGDIKHRMYEGEIWKNIVSEIVDALPNNIYISFDVDGLDPKLCPNTGTPVAGGFETEQIVYLFNKLKESNKKIIGFDLVETGVGENDWDSNVSARLLWKMCNLVMNQ